MLKPRLLIPLDRPDRKVDKVRIKIADLVLHLLGRVQKEFQLNMPYYFTDSTECLGKFFDQGFMVDDVLFFAPGQLLGR